MKTGLLRFQANVTRIFLWTSPIAILTLLATNFPGFEKDLWITPVLAPVCGIAFTAWLFSFLFVIAATLISPKYKEDVLHDVVLRRDRDERESIISGRAAKKSILVTLAAALFILICTTGQYNKDETNKNYSVTIGTVHLTESAPVITQTDGGTTVHYGLPMSKMSLVLLLIVIQLTSYHAINFISLRRSEA